MYSSLNFIDYSENCNDFMSLVNVTYALSYIYIIIIVTLYIFLSSIQVYGVVCLLLGMHESSLYIIQSAESACLKCRTKYSLQALNCVQLVVVV